VISHAAVQARLAKRRAAAAVSCGDSVRDAWKTSLPHLRGLIDRCENLLRSITDDGIVEELERILAEAREWLKGLLGLLGS
jgi:hypothetical protein